MLKRGAFWCLSPPAVELKQRYIVVEGPVGVGKTALTRALAKRFAARSVFEIVEENPFLASFYQDRNKYAFQTQLFFCSAGSSSNRSCSSRTCSRRPPSATTCSPRP